MLRFALLAPLAIPFAPAALAQDSKELREAVPEDRIELKSGREHTGRVLSVDTEQVLLLVGSRTKEFDLEDVVVIESTASRLLHALRRIDEALEEDSSEVLFALSLELLEEGLPLEARLLWWETLRRSPGHAGANERLGHREIRGRWRARFGNGWRQVEDLDALHGEFNDARTLSSTHFDVRTNLRLEKALETIWILERTYHAFFELFASDFGLYHPTEPMESYVYLGWDSFPESVGKRSYFDLVDERAYIGMGGADVESLLHETTHQILFHSGEAIGSRASLPGWLNEGLAQYIPQAVDEAGHLIEGKGDMTGYSVNHFAHHARNDDPYGLKRVLNFDSGDFHGSSRVTEKYVLAYTLTHYLLHAEGRVYRPAFSEYVRGTLHEGKSSSTQFKKAMGIRKEGEFEAAWRAYVEQIAGG